MYKKHRTNPETLPGTRKEPHKGSMGKRSTLSIPSWKREERLEQWRPAWWASTWIRLAVKSTKQALFVFFNSILFYCYAKLICLKHSCNSPTFTWTVLEEDSYYWTRVRMGKPNWNTLKNVNHKRVVSMLVPKRLPLILMRFSHVEYLQDSVQWLKCSVYHCW